MPLSPTPPARRPHVPRTVAAAVALGFAAAAVAGFAHPAPAAAAGYKVTWSSASSYYAYGDTWTGRGCSGTRKRLQRGGTTTASGVQSIKTFTYSTFVTSTSHPQYKVVPVSTCWAVPYSGLWTGSDPALASGGHRG